MCRANCARPKPSMNLPRVQKAAFCFLIAAIVLGIYLPGLNNELVFDDLRFKDNIFLHYGSLLELKQRLLSYGSFVWVQQLFGEGWWKQRIINLLLHGGVVLALYGLMRELLQRAPFPESIQASPHFAASRNAALLVGVGLFAVHPMAVYAVGYLVQRSIVMATLFGVLACWFFVRGLASGKFYWHALALLSYLCAVFSKEHAVMFAAMAVPLYIYVQRPGWKTTAIVVGVSLALLGLIGGVFIKIYGQQLLGQVFDEQSILYTQQLEKLSPGITKLMYPLSAMNEMALFWIYGLLWFIPNTLWMSIDLRPAFPTSLLYFPQVLGAIGFIGLMTVSVVLFLKRKIAGGLLALCLFFPLLFFFTELITVWVQDPFVLYRSYLWAIAIPGILTIILIKFSPKAIYTIGVILALILGGLAYERNQSFRDEYSIWNDAAEKINIQAPANAVGRYRPFLNLGVYHFGKGSYQLAYQNYKTAMDLGALDGAASFNIGVILLKQKNPQEALKYFNEAQTQGFKALASLNYQKGESLVAMGNYPEALKSYTIALENGSSENAPPDELQKFLRAIRERRAQLALFTGQYDIAAEDYALILQSEPQSMRFQHALGLAYTGQVKTAEAIAIFNMLLIQGAHPASFQGRAMAYDKAGNKAAALKDIDQAIAMDPKNPNYPKIRAQIIAGKTSK